MLRSTLEKWVFTSAVEDLEFHTTVETKALTNSDNGLYENTHTLRYFMISRHDYWLLEVLHVNSLHGNIHDSSIVTVVLCCIYIYLLLISYQQDRQHKSSKRFNKNPAEYRVTYPDSNTEIDHQTP